MLVNAVRVQLKANFNLSEVGPGVTVTLRIYLLMFVKFVGITIYSENFTSIIPVGLIDLIYAVKDFEAPSNTMTGAAYFETYPTENTMAFLTIFFLSLITVTPVNGSYSSYCSMTSSTSSSVSVPSAVTV